MKRRAPVLWRLFLAAGLLVAAGLARGTSAAETPEQRAPRLLALGDSYTSGILIDDADRWHEQLAARLREAGHALAEIEMRAVSGWRTSDLRAALRSAPPAGSFEIITVFIGTNDHFSGRPVAEFGADLAQLIEAAIELAGGRSDRVLVMGMPDWTLTPYASQFEIPDFLLERVETYNATLEKVARDHDVHFVALLELSRKQARDPSLFVSDGLHPGREIARRWAVRALPAALSILEKASAGSSVDRSRP